MRYLILALPLLFLSLENLHADTGVTPEMVSAFARQDAPELALANVDAAQDASVDQPQWFAWEVLRWDLLTRLRRWPDLSRRIRDLPSGASEAVRNQALWARLQAAAGLHRDDEVSELLARVLWRGELDAGKLRAARRMVIDSLFQRGRGEDAYRAILRFEQDFRPLSRSETSDFALGLIARGRAADALVLPAPGEEDAIALYIQLRSGGTAPDRAAATAREAIAASRGDGTGYWAVLAEAARLQQDTQALATAMEQLVAARRDDTPELFKAEPEALWQAYLAYATDIGNRRELLQGDDDAWLAMASRLEREDPLAARALLGHLARQAQDAQLRKEAEERLAVGLLRAGLARVANQLLAARKDLVPVLLDSLSRSTASGVAATMWLELGDLARLRGDFQRAAECELLAADGGGDDLRRARILAADSLGQAGLRKDARAQYRLLLDNERDAERRAVLRELLDTPQ